MFSESIACAFDSNDDGVVEESVDIAIPVYGYKTHIGIDKKHRIIRRKIVTDAAASAARSRCRPTGARTAKVNGRKSKDRAKVEHVFAHQKARMGLTIRTVGLARAKAAVTMANMAYNMGRLRWLPGRAKTACA